MGCIVSIGTGRSVDGYIVSIAQAGVLMGCIVSIGTCRSVDGLHS